jgi:hypothetical protein
VVLTYYGDHSFILLFHPVILNEKHRPNDRSKSILRQFHTSFTGLFNHPGAA